MGDRVQPADDARDALRERVAWLDGQKNAFQVAIDGGSLEEALSVLVRTALDQGGPDLRCAFYMADPTGSELKHLIGMPEPYALCVDGFKTGSDSLACGLAVFNGHPVVTEDVRNEPRWQP